MNWAFPYRRLLVFVAVLITNMPVFSQGSISGRVVEYETSEPLAAVSILLDRNSGYTETDQNGLFSFTDLPPGTYRITAFYPGYGTFTQQLKLAAEQDTMLPIVMAGIEVHLSTVEIAAENAGQYSMHRMRNVEGLGIYAARKTEVVELDQLVANLATNNPRQVYQGIAGLNIWENDGAGLQLSIGARGLNPNRTSNFNTRQNGYDISADALGYPESYYTPPTQALRRIEVVRGAASLQYGPQFGGLLNFVFRRGPADDKLQFRSENTAGSFGLFSTFNSLGGQIGDWNYYGFYQRKQGDGWRENAGFSQNTAHFSLRRQIGKKWEVTAEYTYMNYLARQAGGLMDFEFAQDARQSKRARNWFSVYWNLAALKIDYRISDRTRLENRSFYLNAGRDALGELGPINRPDPLRERDLIRGAYRNFGSETRFIHRYFAGDQPVTFLTGVRYYQGLTRSRQGDASDGSDPDFRFLTPEEPERSDYEFPSRNVAWFAENLFQLGSRWTLTPGLRFEYIRTAAEGYYKQRIFSGGELIFEQKFVQSRVNPRSFLLAGLGVGFRPATELEVYGNISQNYRSINFSDLAVVNPNLVIDSTLTDERGFNADLGVRGTAAEGALVFDLSGFYLQYRNRIGIGEQIVPDPVTIEKAVAFRTNIGDARIIGLEAYSELRVLKLLRPGLKNLELRLSANVSLLDGKYTRGRSDFIGNDVELIPPFSLKSGLSFRWGEFRAAWLISHVGSHFTDATNAEFVIDATRGRVPAYTVQDLSLSYRYRWLRLQTGINNLTDARYFTRRAVAYPGPGIIPADGRSFYVTMGVVF